MILDHSSSITTEAPMALNDHTLELCAKWSDHKFHLKDFINGFWLIYDIMNPSADSHYSWRYPELAKTSLTDDPEFRTEISMQILEAGNWNLDLNLKTETREFLQDLHKDIDVHCIGPNFRSQETCIRFSLTIPTLQILCDFLKANSWLGEIEAFKDIIGPIENYIEYYGLGVDIRNGLLPKIGIKVFVPADNAGYCMEKIAIHLYKLKMCKAGKAQALVNWIGESEYLLDGMQHPRKIKRVAYLKIVMSPGSESIVKAYNCYYSPD